MSCSDNGIIWCITKYLFSLVVSGESLCVIDSGHISAAVKEDMTVILLSVNRNGLDTHRHSTHAHLVASTALK